MCIRDRLGDAAYNLGKMRQRRLPAIVWSPDAMVQSWERLEAIERDAGAELRCTHEADFSDAVSYTHLDVYKRQDLSPVHNQSSVVAVTAPSAKGPWSLRTQHDRRHMT